MISFEWREKHFPQTDSWKVDIIKICVKKNKTKESAGWNLTSKWSGGNRL